MDWFYFFFGVAAGTFATLMTVRWSVNYDGNDIDAHYNPTAKVACWVQNRKGFFSACNDELLGLIYSRFKKQGDKMTMMQLQQWIRDYWDEQKSKDEAQNGGGRSTEETREECD